jgi:hypothetical protein
LPIGHFEGPVDLDSTAASKSVKTPSNTSSPGDNTSQPQLFQGIAASKSWEEMTSPTYPANDRFALLVDHEHDQMEEQPPPPFVYQQQEHQQRAPSRRKIRASFGGFARK